LIASAAVLLSGCGAGDGMMATTAVPTSETAQTGAQGQGSAPPPLPAPPAAGSEPSTLIVTAQQRGYLNALAAGGVRPSSDMVALSIGSYVCQARAAKQSDQAVWDFVLPLVRSDVRSAHLASVAPSAAEVDTATADYIRIATERLC
jgi:hypothetical protein